ncbi:hypothetical protein ABC382_00650 [Lysinibacillus sp. 1P01SD]|uniref:sunset domain-containing protein n=1 Tax=Lysinibacillus sp. 1P01SD TaxID=3132285 RepID=UPI0039A35BD4
MKHTTLMCLTLLVVFILGGCNYLRFPSNELEDEKQIGVNTLDGVGELVIVENASDYVSNSAITTTSDSAETVKCLKIKGQINKNKQLIYHLPTGAYYQTIVPEAVFCTEEDAKNAGYTASKR